GPARGARPVVILAAEGDAAEWAVGGVVVDGERRVIEEGYESRPELGRVRERLPERRLRERPLLREPGADRGDDRRHAGAPLGEEDARLARRRRLRRALRRVEFPDEREDLHRLALRR